MKSDSSSSGKSQSLSPEVEFSEKLTFKDYLIATEPKNKQPAPIWRLLIPLIIQTGIILAVPTQALYTNIAGRDLILQSLPQNANDVVEEFALNLDYSISRVANLRRLPGWNNLVRRNQGRRGQLLEGTNIYVILQDQPSFNSVVPSPWRPVRVSSILPESLPSNQIAIKGVYQNGTINYGIETYYLPAEERQEITEEIFQSARRLRGSRSRQIRPITVKVRVDPQGNAVPVSLWVSDRNYRL